MPLALTTSQVDLLTPRSFKQISGVTKDYRRGILARDDRYDASI